MICRGRFIAPIADLSARPGGEISIVIRSCPLSVRPLTNKMYYPL